MFHFRLILVRLQKLSFYLLCLNKDQEMSFFDYLISLLECFEVGLTSSPTQLLPAGRMRPTDLRSNIKPRQISYAVELGSDVLTRQTTSRSPSEMARSVFGQYEWWWKLPLRHGMRSCSDERCRGPVPPSTTNLVGRRLVAGSRSIEIQGGFLLVRPKND